MVVFFANSIRTYDWCRAENQLELCIGFAQRIRQPTFLFRSQNRFFGTIRHVVRTAEVSTFQQPDLQILAPANGFISRTCGRKLFFVEQLYSSLKTDRTVGCPRPAIVLERVVIVFQKVRRRLLIKLPVIGQCENSLPLKSHQLKRHRPRILFVVVFDVAFVNDKVGFDFSHRRIDLVP